MLTTRQQNILNLIVEGYVDTATPLPSDTLARHPELDVSPATVRNEVAVLEDQGYIFRLHTSAGSMPTDKAYRFYVVNLDDNELPTEAYVGYSVKRRLTEAQRDLEEWARAAAAVLSSIVGNMAIATFPRATESRIRHVEVVWLQEVLALVIVVLEHGRLRRQLIRFDTPPDHTDFEKSTNRIRHVVEGRSKREIDSLEFVFSPTEQILLNTTLGILGEEDTGVYRHHHLDGLRNLLMQPEFEENDLVRPVVEAVEDGSLAQAILDEVPPEGVSVRVVIGHENKDNVLQPLSLVVAQYGIPGEVVGVIGAIGPTRMQYSRTISGVRAMTTVLSEMAEGIHVY